jgi:GNAT superfamily N-acetyltransferase
MSTATSALLTPVAPNLTVRPASSDDQVVIVGLIEEASWWLRGKNTDQWARPWPDRQGRDERIRRAIRHRHTWIAWDGEIPAATVTALPHADTRIWPGCENDAAIYLHRLVVSRRYAGMDLGGILIDWSVQRELRIRPVRWIRVEVWRTNTALHAYYERHGFERWGTCAIPSYPAAALFQKDARASLNTNTSLLIEERPSAEVPAGADRGVSRRSRDRGTPPGRQ